MNCDVNSYFQKIGKLDIWTIHFNDEKKIYLKKNNPRNNNNNDNNII